MRITGCDDSKHTNNQPPRPFFARSVAAYWSRVGGETDVKIIRGYKTLSALIVMKNKAISERVSPQKRRKNQRTSHSFSHHPHRRRQCLHSARALKFLIQTRIKLQNIFLSRLLIIRRPVGSASLLSLFFSAPAVTKISFSSRDFNLN
jgi:hypothetical protein